MRIDELDIGFTAVATDVNSEREVWLSRGGLWDAVRASMAVPLVFPPIERGEELLMDGGLINPVPIAPTLNNDSVWTFAVDLNSRPEQSVSITDTDTDTDTGTDADGDHAPDEGQADDSERQSAINRVRARIGGFVDSLVRSDGEDSTRVNAFDIGMKAMEATQITLSRMKLASYSPKLIIPVPRNLCTFFEFYRAEQLIEFGYRRAAKTLDEEGL